MSDYRFYDMLRAQLNEEITAKAGDVAIGIATDYADYKLRCGRIEGLREALACAEDVFKKITGN